MPAWPHVRIDPSARFQEILAKIALNRMLFDKSRNVTDKFIVVGDRILIKPKSLDERTKSGIYLPPGIQEKAKIQSGYVIKTGPGYPVGPPTDTDEPWKERVDGPQYIPLQAKVGDFAIFVQNSAYEIEYEEERYLIVPNSAILLLIREDDDLEDYLS